MLKKTHINKLKQNGKKEKQEKKATTKKTACWVLSLTIAPPHKVINLVKLLLNSAFVGSEELTTPEDTITYLNALCLSTQNFA